MITITDQNDQSLAERVQFLTSLLRKSSVSELDITESGTRIYLHRKPGLITQIVTISSGGSPEVLESSESWVPVSSPLTGVFYSSPSPGSPPFAAEGDEVVEGQTVAMVEAMKVFNEIKADTAGKVVAIVAQNGQLVHKGEALLRILPSS